jgi:hypothetical protein
MILLTKLLFMILIIGCYYLLGSLFAWTWYIGDWCIFGRVLFGLLVLYTIPTVITSDEFD